MGTVGVEWANPKHLAVVQFQEGAGWSVTAGHRAEWATACAAAAPDFLFGADGTGRPGWRGTGTAAGVSVPGGCRDALREAPPPWAC